MPMIRMRTAGRAGALPGQPEMVTTDPHHFPQKKKTERHYCGECFGPRNTYEKRLFCNPCLDKMFPMGARGYDSFLRGMRMRNARFMKRVLERRLAV